MGEITVSIPIHDMHCHLDFMGNGEEVAKAAKEAGSMLFCNTVVPEGYEPAVARFAGFDNVRVGLGLHPWYVDDDPDLHDAQMEKFESLFERTNYIGEVGLDFGRRFITTCDSQVEDFENIARMLAKSGGKVVSLHAIKSAATVLDTLKSAGALDNNICIMHWFSCSVEDLHDAIKAGCYFSINPMMSQTGKGKEYLKLIPVEKMLLETDDPENEGQDYTFVEQQFRLSESLSGIQEVKDKDKKCKMSAEEIEQTISENAQKIFDEIG